MIALLQRVSEARVSVGEAQVAAIGRGILALVAVERGDREPQAERMAERLSRFRLFPDEAGRMNLDVGAAGGSLLLVPQFTLAADTSHGHRPSFAGAAEPDTGRALFEHLVRVARSGPVPVACGRFGADMRVALTNEGPVTFWLRVSPASGQLAGEP